MKFNFQWVFLYTQPTKIWRERGTKQIKILVATGIGVLVLPERKKKINGICKGSKGDLVNFFHCAYFWLSVKTTMQPALDSLKILILREVKKAGREKFQKHQNPKTGKKSMI